MKNSLETNPDAELQKTVKGSKTKKPGSIISIKFLREERPGLHLQSNKLFSLLHQNAIK